MKVCYLILAHNNFDHLNRLLDAIDTEDVLSFCIHIDKKAEVDFNIIKNIKADIIPGRKDIRWGGFSMIEASLALLEYAKVKYSEADYFILISGVDYPIRNSSYLDNLLSEQKEYIDIAPIPVPYKPKERYEYYYFDYDRRNLKFYNPKFLFEVFLKKIGFKRNTPFQVYVGSQWFALTGKCIDYILKAVKEDSRYVKYFRHVLVPDEAFFQTIVAHSPFVDNVATSIVYTDWNVPVPPALIGTKHIEFLEKNVGFQTEYGYCRPYFARKFDDDSKGIVAEIEERLRK